MEDQGVRSFSSLKVGLSIGFLSSVFMGGHGAPSRGAWQPETKEGHFLPDPRPSLLLSFLLTPEKTSFPEGSHLTCQALPLSAPHGEIPLLPCSLRAHLLCPES